MRRGWRWVVAVAVIAGLVAVPVLLAARPLRAAAVDPSALLQRIRGSASVGWSGYGESRGAVALPDVKQLGDLAKILGTTIRYRVWWHDSSRHRVDALSLTGEQDTTADATGSWRWSSDGGIAVRVVGDQPVRLPEEADLVAPTLGRRLAGTRDVSVTAVAPRRVAGRALPGIRLTPRHPATTTIAHIDLYADPRTGLTLEVDVQAAGQRVPVLRSLLLDVALSRPTLDEASFDPGNNGTRVAGRDLAAQVDQRSPYALPEVLGGLAQSGLLPTAQGLTTYGAGFGQVVLLPLGRGAGRDLARSFGAFGDRFDTALLHARLVEDRDRRYLLAGSVPNAVLDAAAADLIAHPPPFRGDS